MSLKSAMLADAPLMLLDHAESGGATALDSSGNGRTGTYSLVSVNQPGIDPSDSLTSAQYSSNSGTQVDYAPWMNVPAFSYVGLVRPDQISGDRVLMSRDFQGSVGPWRIRFSGNSLSFFVWTSTGLKNLSPSYAFLANTTYLIAATFDGSTMRLYSNGDLLGELSVTGTINTNTEPIRVGSYGSGENFIGRMSKVGFYDKALSGARITQYYSEISTPAPTTTKPVVAGVVVKALRRVPPTPIRVAGVTVKALRGTTRPLGTYSEEVLADNPLVFHKLDEAVGQTVALDATGNGRHGTFQNSVVLGQTGLIPSDGGKSARFGGGAHVSNPAAGSASSPPAWQQPIRMSSEAWIKPDTANTAGLQVIGGRNNYQSNFGAGLFSWAYGLKAGKLYLILFTGLSEYIETQSTAVVFPTNGKIHHVAMTFDGANVKGYVDSVLVMTVPRPGNLVPGQSFLNIGMSSDPANYFVGSIDGFAFYDRALSAERITAHYQAGLKSAGPRLRGWWDGTAIQPASGKGFWDGDSVEAAKTNGWWDGDSVESIK